MLASSHKTAKAQKKKKRRHLAIVIYSLTKNIQVLCQGKPKLVACIFYTTTFFIFFFANTEQTASVFLKMKYRTKLIQFSGEMLHFEFDYGVYI